MHPHAGQLVQADDQGLAATPTRREMGRHVLRDGPQARLRLQHKERLAELALQLLALLLVGLRLVEDLGDAAVHLRIVLHVQGFPARLVVERQGGAVVHRPLKVVDRDVLAEGPARQLVLPQKGRPREAQPRGPRQGPRQVLRIDAILRAVRLVREDHHLAVPRDGRMAALKLLDQREDHPHQKRQGRQTHPPPSKHFHS